MNPCEVTVHAQKKKKKKKEEENANVRKHDMQTVTLLKSLVFKLVSEHHRSKFYCISKKIKNKTFYLNELLVKHRLKTLTMYSH